jgi:hypothetical protein
VKSRLDVAVSDLGPTNLKNIADPVRVYSLEVGGFVDAARPSPSKSAEKERLSSWRGPDRPSIAMLAFNNMSGDPEQEYFSDGRRDAAFMQTRSRKVEMPGGCNRGVAVSHSVTGAHAGALPVGGVAPDYPTHRHRK